MFIKLSLAVLLCLYTFTQGNLIPNTYVVEFDQPIHSFANKRQLLEKRSQFYEQLNHSNISYHIRHEYHVINAVSIEFKSIIDASHFLGQSLGVKRAWPVSKISKAHVYHTEHENHLPGLSSVFDFYNSTGIDQVREELGLNGKGIKVGVIDTGVDYMHHALGGCFGTGCRVAYGHDFVGDHYTGENTPIPDSDPRDTCNGHGTHVSGIIGAKDDLLNFTGIAPEVTLGAYRIFGCLGSSSDDLIMKAMEKAYLDGMDIVNLSLGDIGWPESPASLLANELSLKGMIVCAAAGNEGQKGMFEVGAPSLGRNALSVASVDNLYAFSHTLQFGDLLIGYSTNDNKRLNITSAEVVPLSSTFMSENDGCKTIPDNLQNKVALISRGGCFFSEKKQIKNAQTAGAVGVILYNNVPGVVHPSVPNETLTIGYCGISQEDGLLLFTSLNTNPTQPTKFLQEDRSFIIPSAGHISTFSSWGLGPDLSLKPDISAPGGQIYSIYPIDLGSYATLSGTSMASPYIAGIVALLQQSRGGKRAIAVEEIRSMLLNNGDPFHLTGFDVYDSVARQGSGLVNIYKAITSDTAIFPEQIRLNDNEHNAVNNEYTITIKNNGRMQSEYVLSHVPSISAQGYEIKGRLIPLNQPLLLSNHELEATVEMDETNVSVRANEEKTVNIRIIPPINSNQHPPSIYSGYIKIEEGNNVKYVPYAGFTANISDMPVIIVNDTMPRMINDKISIFSPALIALQLSIGSPLLTVSVVDASDHTVNYGYIPGGYSAYIGRHDVHDMNDVLLLPWYGNIAINKEQAALGILHKNTHLSGYSQNSGEIQSDASHAILGNIGNRLKKGKYRLKIMALRPFGSIQNENDYDIWYSPNTEIN
ncbi:peptidase S8/S53 domain-containing protein [Pilobolus umbonatus]|nr:peptidase S8/S53 domain-containing protein [Pilobolus umbonatus]